MSSYFTKTINCRCCQREYKARLLRGFISEGAKGLDGNPYNPAIFDSVTMCPFCGYSTQWPKKELAEQARAYVFSEPYHSLASTFFDELLKKIVLAASINHLSKNFKTSANLYLMAFWYTQSSGHANYEYLNLAIGDFSTYLNFVADHDTALVLIDCLRQAGRFAEAEETAYSLLERTPDMDRVIRFELKCIEERDRAPHKVSEVAQ